jgi:hypothetical protein
MQRLLSVSRLNGVFFERFQNIPASAVGQPLNIWFYSKFSRQEHKD